MQNLDLGGVCYRGGFKEKENRTSLDLFFRHGRQQAASTTQLLQRALGSAVHAQLPES